jgi:hypothetical protein
MNPESPEFQRAFVAVSYLAGVRGDALLTALGNPHEQARELVARLGVEDRASRARTLAGELEVIARRLSRLELRS